MRRRNALSLLGGVAALAPLVMPRLADAQQPRIPTIGYLSSNWADNPPGDVAAFRAGLAEAGFNEGGNVAIDYRFAEGDYDRLPSFAMDPPLGGSSQLRPKVSRALSCELLSSLRRS